MKTLDILILTRAGRWGAALALFAVAAISACGGGGGGVGTGGTGGYASGPISGFGSIIVNDVRYDESAAQVLDGDGNVRSSTSLQLGMTVSIDSGAVATAAGASTAKANIVRYDSELLGPASAVDIAGSAFTVLGQKVSVDPTTVFATGAGGLSALRTGTSVEVFAVYDPAGLRYRATRVALATAGDTPRVRGPVSALDTTAQTLRVGNASFGYAPAAGVPSGLAVGQFVRMKLQSATTSNGRYTVQAFGTAVPSVPDADGASVKGLVTGLATATSFSVNGLSVDASAATFTSGRSVALGTRVTVAGVVRSGVLRAASVTVITDQEEDAHTFELHGSIDSVDSVAHTFTLRGQTIGTSRSDLVYQNGTAAQLAVGRSVEVKGLLSADGLRIDATSINFE